MPIDVDHLKNTRADYAARLDDLKVDYPAKATKADLHRILVEALSREVDAALGRTGEGEPAPVVDLATGEVRSPGVEPGASAEPATSAASGSAEPDYGELLRRAAEAQAIVDAEQARRDALTATPEPVSVEQVEAAAELVVAPPPPDTLPTPSRWQQLREMSRVLANSALVRPALRGQPDDITLILLTGHDLGISSTMALSKINVIEGMPSASAELMTALVRRSGHRLWGETSATEATVHGARRTSPDEVMTVTFTLEDAAAAGLCSIKDGRARARSRYDKPLPWESYTADMLWARAVSRLCRRLFSDVLAGMTYTPEELGSIIDDDASLPDVRRSARVGPVPDLCEGGEHDGSGLCCRAAVRQRIADLPDAERAEVAERWRQSQEAHELPALRNLDWPAVPLVGVILADAERKAAQSDGIEDAEVVEEAPTGPGEPADAPLGPEGAQALGEPEAAAETPKGPACEVCRDVGFVEVGDDVEPCPNCGV